MDWKPLHHPDFSLPVIRRKASDNLLDLLYGTSDILLSRGRSVIFNHCYPNNRAYSSAVYRLEKAGLIAKRKTDGSLPSLTLSKKGETRFSGINRPEKYWNANWIGIWYVLMFDVPETNRAYRDSLRGFLKRHRMGCLQKSVWVTPRDIRPEYQDLNEAAAVDDVAFLFEAKTVLGRGSLAVAKEAWDFGKLNSIQSQYLKVTRENLKLLNSTSASQEELIEFFRLENTAYTQAMFHDPLLPSKLHPPAYLGRDVFSLHQCIRTRIAGLL
ncbi:MAG: hypothetical protein K9M45_02695 [Kiritimatiellales bacterium]|nr:hypothetical protein [Kiritimatiellales bacterium]